MLVRTALCLSRGAYAAAVLATTALLFACHSATEPASSEYTIRIDSVSGNNTVSGGVATNAFLWGVVGPGGYTAFKELRTTRIPSRVDVAVIGQRLSAAPPLPDAVPLNGVPCKIQPPIPNDFQMGVHQPDGTTLVRRVYG